MRYKGTKTILLLILITIAGIVSACSATEQSETVQKAEGTNSEVLIFETTELAINPSEVNPGVEIIITAQVENKGDTEGNYTAGLMINDATAATTVVILAAGANQLVSFVGSVATPGTYKVT